MIDFWKLPKADRGMCEKRIIELIKLIEEKTYQCANLENRLEGAKFDLTNAKKELDQLKKKYNIPE